MRPRGVRSTVMRRHSNSEIARWALALAPVLVGLGGCGGGSTASQQSFSASTSAGLSYTLETTQSGNQVCATTTIRAALPDGRPGVNTSHACGPAALGHPLLIQAKSSPESIVIDAPTAGCGPVRGGPSHAALRPLVMRCSSGRPLTRATILPSTKQLVIVGIPKVPVINFPRHRCRIICVTALA